MTPPRKRIRTNWGGKRPGTGSKPGIPRGRYSQYNRVKPPKPAELRHRKLNLRLTPAAIAVLRDKSFDLNQAIRDNADLPAPDKQSPIKGGRKQVNRSFPPDVYAIIKSKSNQSGFVEMVLLNERM